MSRRAVIGVAIVMIGTVGALVSAQRPPGATSRVAFIRTQRILTESADASAGVARFQALQKQKTAELQSRQQAIAATGQQVAAAADAATRSRLQAQEQKQRADLAAAAAQAQAELQGRQRELQTELQGQLTPVLDELLKGRDIDLVLNADTSVVWSAPGLDLSSEVIARLNAGRAPAAPKP